MINVPDPFTLSVVYMTTDAMPSYAESASRKIVHPTFEVMVNLANCEIEAGQKTKAISTLTSIQQKFSGTNHDAQTGLRCKYEVRFGSVDAAEGLWSALRNRGTPVHAGLRLSILRRKSIEVVLSDAEEAERQKLVEKQSIAELERNERMLGSILSTSE